MTKQKCPFCKSLIDHLYYINLKTDLTIGRFFPSKSNVAVDVVENISTEKYQCPLCHGIIAMNIVDADAFMKTGKMRR